MAYMREVKEFGEEYELIANSQDITDLLDYLGLGLNSDYRDAGFALVKLDDSSADYAEVWFCMECAVPWLSANMERVYPPVEKPEFPVYYDAQGREHAEY
jgi:hypothetical protein